MKKLLATSLFFFVTLALFSQNNNPLIDTENPAAQQKWVDSVYNSFSLEQKIGQLFMVDVFSRDPKAKTDKVKKLIAENYIGGVIFSKGGPIRQAKLNNEFQDLAKTPLLVGMDAEWGLSMRLDSTFAYPWNMTLGAIKDNAIVEEVGYRIGEHSKRMGVHINFAPVVDININPKNPIIGNRSFGEDRENVTQKAISFMQGMQRAGVLANAKHFPGHGDTDTDSHKSLPTLMFSRSRLDSVELYPYRRIIKSGVSSVMVAHLNIPSLENNEEIPSSISENIVTTLLQEELGFQGLIFTDALNMKGASNFKEPGEIDLAAFLAGNDILLISEDIPKAQALLIKSYKENVFTEKRLAHSVKKILQAKYKVGLHNYEAIDQDNLFESLNRPVDNALYEKAMSHAITLVKNEDQTLPIKDLTKENIAYVSLGDAPGNAFFEQLKKYANITHVKAKDLQTLQKSLKAFTHVIIGFHKSNANPWKDYKTTERERNWILEIARKNKTTLAVFARPYALLYFESTKNIASIVMSYQNSTVSQEITAQIIFGARTPKGKLPVSVGEFYPKGTGLSMKGLPRLRYGTPESVGFNTLKLSKIDSFAQVAMSQKMTPGMQILVARKGKVVYHKNFGYHTYDKKIKVTDSSIYDVASLTKILVTVPLVMELMDQGTLTMDTTIGSLLPEFKDSNKASISLKRMLSHNARFQAWIPFYTETIDPSLKKPSVAYYRTKPVDSFTTQVAKNLYIRNDFKDSIYAQIKESDLRKRKGYKYSDLPYYLLKKYLETYYEASLDEIIKNNFYSPLGLTSSTYTPLLYFDENNIPPTENDTYFRMQKVQGYVHDQGAAMLGGISGHAGLFSTANDIAKMMQMYLWKGAYGTSMFFSPQILDSFNTCYYCDDDIRRGVGFDKPQLGDVGPTCGCISMTSFGHSGFTGTFTWADPEEDIVYVFLSNRTFPDADNRKLIKTDLRSNIQGAIYEALEKE